MVNNGNGSQILHYKKRRFLEHYISLCVIGKAAEATGVARRTVYDWMEKSGEFKQAFEDAKQSVTEKLEVEAIRRAYAGIDKAVWYKGKAVGVEKEFSDTLLIFLLKAVAPEKYRERIEHTGAGGEPLVATFVFQMPDGTKVSPGALAQPPK